MKVLAAAALAVLVVGACASPAPTPPGFSPAGTPIPPASVAPSPANDVVVGSTGATVRFDGWTATCSAVPTNDCEGVAKLFVNNLARSWKGVLDASGGGIVVEVRPACPASMPDWADSSSCWQATAPASTGEVCMVIARHPKAEGAVSTFGQVGGDEMAGRAGGPPSGWPVCD